MYELRVWAPDAHSVEVEVRDDVLDGVFDDRWLEDRWMELRREGPDWIGQVPVGARYRVRVNGATPVVDPMATELWFGPTHQRDAPDAWAVAQPWPDARPSQRTTRPLFVLETHVRGLTRLRDRSDAGTFGAMVGELARMADLGVSVVELLPIHQFDPAEGNYWGYMPVVFGAVHAAYGTAAELATMIDAAHRTDIEVWVDVVVNHTTEEDRDGPTLSLRGIAPHDYYVIDETGEYVDDAGCGNIIDATSPPAQRLVIAGLDRLADLGVDGFRFDLAAVLARDPEFVRSIGDWSERRGVRLIAEPWDLRRYLLGRGFPDLRWAQWNGRFRDDMRGFLRGESGMIPSVMRRFAGSPDLFDQPDRSINFLTSHDGFTMFDLVGYDHKHNDANGWNGTDGTDDNRSWNCGWEGEGAPADIETLRRRQLRNAMCLLLLSQGTPMIVAGDEFGRTQHGNNNPYNQDDETSWIDWTRRDDFADHERFVARLIRFRSEHDVLTQTTHWGEAVEWYGTSGSPDLGPESRSLAWHVDGLYVMANMWWDSVEFDVQVPGSWRVVIDTADEEGFVSRSAGEHITVAPRSIIVLVDQHPPVPVPIQVVERATLAT